MPLRLRLALIVAAGLTVLLVATGFAFVHQLQDSLTASIDTSLWSRRHVLLTSLREHPLSSGRQPVAVDSLQSGTQLFAADGRLAVRSADDVDDTGAGPLLTETQVAQARRGPLWLTVNRPDAPYPVRVLAFPLPPGTGEVVGVVSASTALLDQAVDHVEEGFLFGGPVAVVGGAFAGWLLAGAALRPVERMRRQAANATLNDSDPVLDVPGTRDEIAALAQTLNGLLARLRGAVARERAFVADAGHELRTPLSILRTELELAGKPHRTREELVAAIRAAADETDRLVRLTEGLLLLAREQDERFLHRRRVEVRPLLEAVISGFLTRARQRRARLLLDVQPAGLTATWDEDLIRQVVANVVDNALRYGCVEAVHGVVQPPTVATSGVARHDRPFTDREQDDTYRPPWATGRIADGDGTEDDGGTHVVRITAAGFAGRVVLTVHDDGPGFPEDFLPHAFERFSRADSARSSAEGGSGLGLSIVDLITRVHGGRVSVGNRPEGGAEVVIDIPEPR